MTPEEQDRVRDMIRDEILNSNKLLEYRVDRLEAAIKLMAPLDELRPIARWVWIIGGTITTTIVGGILAVIASLIKRWTDTT